MTRTIAVVLSFILLSGSLPAQQHPAAPPFGSYVVTNFTSDNGLPQNTVDLITQTSDGYLWIGTYAGLARYDGIRFIHFNKSITPAFRINHVTSLVEDKNGAVWIGTNGGGIVRYANHLFSSVSGLDTDEKAFVKTMLYAGVDDILAGSERGGIQKLVTDDEGNLLSVTPFTTADLPRSFLLRTMVRDQKGRVLVATDIGLIIIENGVSRTMTTANGLPNNSITALAVDQSGVIWAGTQNGLARIEGTAVRTFTTADGMTTNAIRTLFVDKDNTLWIGTDGGGLNRYISTGKRPFDALTTDDGLVNNFIRTIFQDSENSIWIGTRNGMSQLHLRKFELFGKRQGLSDSYVRTVLEDSRRRIWTGTNGNGLNRLDSSGVKVWNTEKELPNKFIRALFEDGDGIIWIGTDGDGIVRFNERARPGSQFTRLTTANGLTENYIRAIQPGFRREVWVATYGGGISRIAADSIIPLTQKEGLANDNVLAMVRDKKDIMWVGTNGGGINKVTPKGITAITTKDGLSNNFILSIYVDKDGVVWAGTNGGGINRIEGKNISVFTTAHGLREDVTLMIMEDNNGFLWIGGNQGITRVKKSDFTAVIEGRLKKLPKIDFGSSDGLQNAEISGVSAPCIIRSADGKIWFTTVGGLACVNPDKVNEESVIMPIHIEEVRTNDRAFVPDTVITLSAGTPAVEFHYTSVSFIAPERIRFRYKLDGFDEDWTDAGTRRTAYYTNLPPGRYTFTVSTSIDDGTWSSQSAKAEIVLTPFFYQTPYFFMLTAFGLVMIGAGLYAFRTANVHRHAKHLKSVVDERTKDLLSAKDRIEVHLKEVEAARDELSRSNSRLDKANKEKSDLLGILSHDFKNKVVNLNHFAHAINQEDQEAAIVKEHANLMEQTTNYMLRLIEDTLSSSALEKGQLVFTKGRVDIVQLTELVVLKNRIQLQQKSQTIEFSSNADACIVSGSERWLNEAIDNLVNNASKFSQPGTSISVRLVKQEMTVRILVKDMGPGLTEEDKKNLFQQFKRLSAQPTGGEISTGLGLAIVQKITEMHNGSVWAESENGLGSTFIIELPVYRPL